MVFPELLLALPDAEKDLGVEEGEDDEGDDAGGQQPRPHPVVRYVVLVPPELGHTNLEHVQGEVNLDSEWRWADFGEL